MLPSYLDASQEYDEINLTSENVLVLDDDKYLIGEEEHTYSNGDCSVLLTGSTTHEIKINADCDIKISNLSINSSDGAAIKINEGSSVNLLILNENTLTGATGYAGINVPNGANLTISENSSGTLYVTGGDSDKKSMTAGAGIGGNGQTKTDITTNNFGKIIINGGKVFATGGTTYSLSYGGGAGIGAGGASSNFIKSSSFVFSGEIVINDGEVSALGGTSTSSGPGGAGIGSGGNNGNLLSNTINVTINGGSIIAQGSLYGAGIGGGNGTDSGDITITGGTILALGSDEPDDPPWGGAGIGGGDSGGVNSITISGEAVVVAIGYGAASGIGAGFDQGVHDIYNNPGTITIKGNSQVIAVGGSATTKSNTYGGAGIGSGGKNYNDNYSGAINIEENATIIAYAGANAQAIGTGSNYKYSDSDTNLITIGDSVLLVAINDNEDVEAVYNFSSDNLTLNNVIYNTESEVYYYDGNEVNTTTYTYTYENEKLNIYREKSELLNIKYNKDLGNFVVKLPIFKIEVAGDNVSIEQESSTVLYGDTAKIFIVADLGYEITNITVNGEEQTLPLKKDILEIENITSNTNVNIIAKPIIYKIISGDNQTHLKGSSKDLTVTSNILYPLFASLEVCDSDGVCKTLIKDVDYTITEDGEITFVASYLEKLDIGKYTFILNLTNGTIVTGAFSVTSEIEEETPKTEDKIMQYVAFGATGLVVAIGILVANKKHLI